MQHALLGDRLVVAVAAIVTLAGLAIGLGNLVAPPGLPFHAPTYVVSLAGKYLRYAILALGTDLVWGYGGILSLGHAVFFGLGGYAMSMHLMRMIGPRGVYGRPCCRTPCCC